MRRQWGLLPVGVLLVMLPGAPTVESACCYFAAKDKDILQPAQKAFLTWDPVEKVETFTVQPKFEGNAVDFGMVIPTPTQPKLHEMPRDFFKELAVFTILEPMDLNKYKPLTRLSNQALEKSARDPGRPRVIIKEAGVVGTLDYKIIVAEQADALFNWLKEHKYNYSGDEASLDFYVRKGWFFTVMKIDPMQMKKKPDGSYEGEISPTRFTFASERLIYPLKITQISVKDKTEALFYVQAPHKVDLPGDFSYQCTWVPMWSQATGFALPEKLTREESSWQQHVQPRLPELQQQAQRLRQRRVEPSALEWAKRITPADIDVLDGKKAFNREAPRDAVMNLKILKGNVRQGQFVTKVRKVFTKAEMSEDLTFVRAQVGGRDDNIEYYSILPTSPP